MVLRRLTHAGQAAALAALAAAGCASLAGCAPTACTADLIVDHFALTATSSSHPRPSLAVCVQGSCSAIVSDIKGRTGATNSEPGLSLYVQKADSWTVAVDNGTRPSTITTRLYDDTTLLATRTVKLSWHRADPQDTCHDWYTTDDVHIAVP